MNAAAYPVRVVKPMRDGTIHLPRRALEAALEQLRWTHLLALLPAEPSGFTTE